MAILFTWENLCVLLENGILWIKKVYTKVKTETTSLMWGHTDNKMRKLVILIFLPSFIVLNCLQYTKALVYLNIFNRTVILVSLERVEEVTLEIGGKSESHPSKHRTDHAANFQEAII